MIKKSHVLHNEGQKTFSLWDLLGKITLILRVRKTMTSEQHTCFCFDSGKCVLLEGVIHMPETWKLFLLQVVQMIINLRKGPKNNLQLILQSMDLWTLKEAKSTREDRRKEQGVGQMEKALFGVFTIFDIQHLGYINVRSRI